MRGDLLFSTVEVCLLLVLFSGCSLIHQSKVTSEVGDGKIHVATTTFTLYEFASQVGGDNVYVFLLPFKTGVGLLEQVDIETVRNADLFIFIGLNQEPWVADFLESLDDRELHVLDLSNRIEFTEEYESTYYREYEQDEFLGINLDFWLDFEKDKEIVSQIEDELSSLDSPNAGFYRANANSYNQRLNVLGMLYKDKLSKCESLSDPEKLRQIVLSIYNNNGFDLIQRRDFITMIYENLDLIVTDLVCD
ncbi:zinc ABC transporter substrate-binding protein [Candidatus Woesearchaeota archaeon]|nr:zinc ABC transporter substrate-binding protein [Candidatus Woesearchaeota archaeon]